MLQKNPYKYMKYTAVKLSETELAKNFSIKVKHKFFFLFSFFDICVDNTYLKSVSFSLM